MPTYNIGVNKPFRLTRRSCSLLIQGLMEAGGKLTYIAQDKTAPPTCAIIQVELPASAISRFRELLAVPVDLAYSMKQGA